ncbi:MAG: flagellin [Candidatus Poribacteria bacterium]
MFRINTNVLAMTAQRKLIQTGKELSTSMERLSSGLRINHAADDPAGLVASETLRARIAGQKTANDNISRAIVLLQTADSSLAQIGDMLIRLKELAEQSADGTLNDSDRSGLSTEATALIAEIDRVASSTTFNGISLIDSAGVAQSRTNLTFYIGDGTGTTAGGNMVAGLALKGVVFNTGGLGSIGDTGFNFTLADFLGQVSAQALVTSIDAATTSLATIRTDVGAFQNRMERAQADLQSAMENSTASLSTIRDADFAVEASALARAQILAQAGASMLSQANLVPRLALTLIQ